MAQAASGKRESAIRAVSGETLDVFIVGGGIVGSGVARDGAMRGLRVGLVEQHDFAFGTSSRSSRLLHGGLRYLAQGRVGLVHEASVEKRIVHHIAPHLADPLAFLFPTYRCAPWAQWALWKLRIGVKIYDLLCGGRNLGKSTSFSAKALTAYLPGVQTRDLTGAVRYYDGLTNDARLVIDTLRSAEKAGASVVNYCRFESARFENGTWRCALTDVLTGGSFEATARCIVNAAGPWADKLEHSSVNLRPTKGVHLVVDRKRLPVPDAVVMTEGSRILFAIPWGERTILGTTDTDYNGPLDRVLTEPEDQRYILRVVNGAFPEAKLTDEDVIAAWAGLRPLIASSNGRPSDISRSHEIRNPKPGWWDVAGGKLTTYRLMAEQTVDALARHLRRKLPLCETARRPLLEKGETDNVSGIVPPALARAAVEHYCRNEWAVHLDDVMARRGGWHFYHRDAAQTAETVAGWMGEILGWDDATRRAELDRYRDIVGAGEGAISRKPDNPSPSRVTP